MIYFGSSLSTTMPRTSTIAKVGKRKARAVKSEQGSCFPADHIIKAELIEYYLTNRPDHPPAHQGTPSLSFVRYPDGIDHQPSFKDPAGLGAPDWVQHISLGDTGQDRLCAGDRKRPHSCGLANLACIEVHQMHSRAPHF